MTEQQRVKAISSSGTPGGDGVANAIIVEPNSTEDLIGNKNTEQIFDPIFESADVILPIVEAAKIDLNDGTVVINVSETVDLTPASSKLNLSLFHFANVTRGNEINLQGATVIEQDALQILLTLTEEQRIRAIEISQDIERGGDGIVQTLEVLPNALLDIGQNGNLDQIGIPVTEVPDVTKPSILNVSLNYSQGLLVFTANEYIDSTPSTKIDVGKLILRQYEAEADVKDIYVDSPLSILSKDGYTIQIQLSEAQRYRGVQMSGTPGGDGNGIYVEIVRGFANDIAQVPNGNQTLLVAEYDDIIGPTIEAATINYTDGTLRIFGSETIDSDPKNNTRPELIRISNRTGDNGIVLEGATVFSSELTYVDFILTELQRVQAIASSNTTGGDGSPNILDMSHGAIVDIATAPSPVTLNIPLIEHGDILRPSLLSTSLNYSDGVIKMTFSETIDFTPGGRFVLSKMFFQI